MKRSFRAAASLAAAASLCIGTVAAAEELGLSKRDADAPIQWSADHFDADIDNKTGLYTGNVIITQGDFHLRADKVRIDTKSGKPDKIYAYGNVVFTAPTGNAQGDNGVYDVGPRLITLTGHVILTKAKNVMRGSTPDTKLTVDLISGHAQLVSAGGRVQGLFTPPPKSTPPAKSSH